MSLYVTNRFCYKEVKNNRIIKGIAWDRTVVSVHRECRYIQVSVQASFTVILKLPRCSTLMRTSNALPMCKKSSIHKAFLLKNCYLKICGVSSLKLSSLLQHLHPWMAISDYVARQSQGEHKKYRAPRTQGECSAISMMANFSSKTLASPQRVM